MCFSTRKTSYLPIKMKFVRLYYNEEEEEEEEENWMESEMKALNL